MDVTEPQPTTRGRRALGYTIDAIAIWLVFMFGFGFEDDLYNYTRGTIERDDFRTSAQLMRIGQFAVLIVYSTLMELTPWRATVGKKLALTEVVSEDGSRATPRQVVIRNVAKIASAGACGLGFWWVLWDKKGQAWHDKLARTMVVSVGREP